MSIPRSRILTTVLLLAACGNAEPPAGPPAGPPASLPADIRLVPVPGPGLPPGPVPPAPGGILAGPALVPGVLGSLPGAGGGYTSGLSGPAGHAPVPGGIMIGVVDDEPITGRVNDGLIT
ncbi:MAG: hypothetical protein RLO50_02915, partial [Azospirillaceae bacterium]